jgi:uncharacterized protein (TIGR03437 family)
MQINAIVPWEVSGQGQTMVQVQVAGGGTASFAVPLASADPGIFTSDFTGSGQAVAANQDYSRNSPSNPAAVGSYVTVYFTGGGITSPAGSTGSISGQTLRYLTQTVTATVGGVAANVSFVGAAPGLLDGVNQLNIQLAVNTPTGSAVPLVISVGGQSSTASATLSVH